MKGDFGLWILDSFQGIALVSDGVSTGYSVRSVLRPVSNGMVSSDAYPCLLSPVS